MNHKHYQNGFTVVELIVVMVVLVVLVMITYFILSGWRVEVARSEVQYDLRNASSELKMYKNFNGGYPADNATFQSEYTSTPTVTLTYAPLPGGGYCVQGNSTVEDVQYSTTNGESPVEGGSCS